jgi:hypothetical protein
MMCKAESWAPLKLPPVISECDHGKTEANQCECTTRPLNLFNMGELYVDDIASSEWHVEIMRSHPKKIGDEVRILAERLFS